MAITIKSGNKYYSHDREKLNEVMKEEGFIFKNSARYNDDFFIDVNDESISKDSCIRLRRINDKELLLTFDGVSKGIGQVNEKEVQNVHLNVEEYGNIISFLANIGMYKYITLNVLKETYVKKEKEFYYSISIDTIEGIGEFIDYDIYTEIEDKTVVEAHFRTFENKLGNCLSEKLDNKYRDFTSKLIFDTFLKGEYLEKILVETDKIFIDKDLLNIEKNIKNKYTLMNLELIERLENKGVVVEIVYSENESEYINKLKNELNRVGYAPKFINIKEIKELAVRKTLIIEKQKTIDFCQAAFIILNNMTNK